MCRLQGPSLASLPSLPSSVVTGRRLVRKYRRLSLRREMRRLRRILPTGPSLHTGEEVILETIALIQALEGQLLERVRGGKVPSVLGHLHPTTPMDIIREEVARSMVKPMDMVEEESKV